MDSSSALTIVILGVVILIGGGIRLFVSTSRRRGSSIVMITGFIGIGSGALLIIAGGLMYLMG
jgi:hypothetical protein